MARIYYDYSDMVRDPSKQSQNPALKAAFHLTLNKYARKLVKMSLGQRLTKNQLRLLSAIICDAQERAEGFADHLKTSRRYKSGGAGPLKRRWLRKVDERKLQKILKDVEIIANGLENDSFGEEFILEAVYDIKRGISTLMFLSVPSRDTALRWMKKDYRFTQDPTDLNLKEIYLFFREDLKLVTRRAEHFTAKIGNHFLGWNVSEGTESSGSDAIRKRVERKGLAF